MIEPAPAVLPNSSSTVGASSCAGFVAQHAFGDQPVHVGIGLVQPEPAHVGGLQVRVPPFAAGSSPTPSAPLRLNTLRPCCVISLSGIVAAGLRSQRLRKPKLLRMLLENSVFSFEPRIAHAPARRDLSRSRPARATAASPKMKCVSRSRKLRWPVVSSGLTTSTERAWPARTMSIGVLDRERGRRAGDVHVVAKAACAELVLHFDRQRRIGALQRRARADHGVDVGWDRGRRVPALASPLSPRTSAMQRKLLVRPLRNIAGPCGRHRASLLCPSRSGALMPEAFSMNSTLEGCSAVSSPAAISAACSALNRST